jgi:hypothetical protein
MVTERPRPVFTPPGAGLPGCLAPAALVTSWPLQGRHPAWGLRRRCGWTRSATQPPTGGTSKSAVKRVNADSASVMVEVLAAPCLLAGIGVPAMLLGRCTEPDRTPSGKLLRRALQEASGVAGKGPVSTKVVSPLRVVEQFADGRPLAGQDVVPALLAGGCRGRFGGFTDEKLRLTTSSSGGGACAIGYRRRSTCPRPSG